MFNKDKVNQREWDLMSMELIAAVTAITSALAFYTIGVFSERKLGYLKRSHLLFFWLGLVCDTTGTMIMSNIAQSSGGSGMGIHALTGMLAIVLMLIHATWATGVYLKGSDRMRTFFHRFSSVVWLIWLVPYIIGMLVGIPAIHLLPVCAIGTSVVVVTLFAIFMLRTPRSKKHQH